MNSIKPTTLVAILFGAAFAASVVQAGDVKGKVSSAGLKSVENVVVYLDAIPGKKFDPPSVHATMDQVNMKFVPHILVISRGTTVEFKNSDQVAHNIYWPSIGGNKALRHNLTILSPDHTKIFQFDTSGAAHLLCNLHPEMGRRLVPESAGFACVPEGVMDRRLTGHSLWCLRHSPVPRSAKARAFHAWNSHPAATSRF